MNGQLDMDRLDYLRRDSFYTGVTEGNIGSARIIKMLNIKEDQLVVDYKGIYSIENFLMARRLMYWQVYFHKSSVAYERMLINTLLRAKKLASQGVDLFASPSLRYFLYTDVQKDMFFKTPEALENFTQLDDNDIWTSLKVWCTHPDKILSLLSQGMVQRKLFKVEVQSEPITLDQKEKLIESIKKDLNITVEEAQYLIACDGIEKNMYNPVDDSINILYDNGEIKNIAEASDMLNVSLLSKRAKKYYLCHYRIGTQM